MSKRLFENFYDEFVIGSVTSKSKLTSYINKFYENLKPITLAWRIFDLKNSGYIQDIGNNEYRVVDKNQSQLFEMVIDTKTLDFLMKYNKKFNTYKSDYFGIDIRISIWETYMLNQFMSHQMYKNFIIIEVDETRIDNLFYEMKEDFKDVVPLSKIKGFDYLSYKLQNVIIIQKLPKRSPLYANKKNNYVSIPKPEKILVDLLVYNEDIYNIDQNEILSIYRNMIINYRVSVTTLLSYARIRGQKIKNKVLNILNEIEIINHDR
ncbi:MAG: DUF6577 family protein [Acholeplasmataceae bacterium]